FEIYKKRHLLVSLCFVIRYRFKIYKNEHIHDSKFLITRVYFGQKLQILIKYAFLLMIRSCVFSLYTKYNTIVYLYISMNF
ncbi:MAG: hypothetical protein N4A49_08030, partial [Marinifilaceae bacterium]|nr:hypothetical protein [Marinifilaceae bacterium]